MKLHYTPKSNRRWCGTIIVILVIAAIAWAWLAGASRQIHFERPPDPSPPAAIRWNETVTIPDA
ncbi:MAG: hypothetical protein RBG13Loki_2147 [Promethearchaeota archaeon CR_4]|nr:MAG: hypothetical protein RBG13Loki_2147 [Candidatus Lokiarchaeota archaeon CR_4]